MELPGRLELAGVDLSRAVHKRILCYKDQSLNFQLDYKGILHIKVGRVLEIARYKQKPRQCWRVVESNKTIGFAKKILGLQPEYYVSYLPLRMQLMCNLTDMPQRLGQS